MIPVGGGILMTWFGLDKVDILNLLSICSSLVSTRSLRRACASKYSSEFKPRERSFQSDPNYTIKIDNIIPQNPEE